MTPRDTLQRLLIEHRTAHDPASSEREILRMFDGMLDALVTVADWYVIDDRVSGDYEMVTGNPWPVPKEQT